MVYPYTKRVNLIRLFALIVLNFNFGFKVLTDRNKRSEMLWSVNVYLMLIQLCYVELQAHIYKAF